MELVVFYYVLQVLNELFISEQLVNINDISEVLLTTVSGMSMTIPPWRLLTESGTLGRSWNLPDVYSTFLLPNEGGY